MTSRVSSPASAAREGDPLTPSAAWIPLRCAAAGNDTAGLVQRSYFVLDFCSKLGYIVVQLGPDEGRAREASQCGSRHGPAAGLASLRQEARRGLRLRRPPKRTVREEASWLFLTNTQRAGLPSAPPSIILQARSAGCGPAGPCLVRWDPCSDGEAKAPGRRGRMPKPQASCQNAKRPTHA